MTTVQAITVADLIKFLKKQKQDLPVCYGLFSEQCLLELKDIEVENLCPARPDGWVHHKRPDVPGIDYLVFPGN